MSDQPRTPLTDELGQYVDADERRDVEIVAERLLAERPSPRLGWRVDMRRWAAASAKDTPPALLGGLRLRTAILAYAGAGVLLLGFAALGVAGAGPLAP